MDRLIEEGEGREESGVISRILAWVMGLMMVLCTEIKKAGGRGIGMGKLMCSFLGITYSWGSVSGTSKEGCLIGD